MLIALLSSSCGMESPTLRVVSGEWRKNTVGVARHSPLATRHFKRVRFCGRDILRLPSCFVDRRRLGLGAGAAGLDVPLGPDPNVLAVAERHPAHQLCLFPRAFFAAFRRATLRAIAIAWSRGLPAAISVLMLADTDFLLDPCLIGIVYIRFGRAEEPSVARFRC